MNLLIGNNTQEAARPKMSQESSGINWAPNLNLTDRNTKLGAH